MEMVERSSSPQPPAPTHGTVAEEDAAPPPSARSAVPGSPLRLYVAHFLVLEEGEGEEGRAPLHQYLYEHPNGLFIVGLAELHAAIQAVRSGETTIARVEFLPSFPAAAGADAVLEGAAAGGGGAGGMEEAEEQGEQEDEGEAQEADAAAAGVGGGGGEEARVAALVAGNRVAAGKRRGRQKKKGDLLVEAGTVLASVVLEDGRTFRMPCGVAGQVLELNERVAADPALLARKPTTEAFLAVIQPPRFPTAKQPPPDRSNLVPFEEYWRRFGDAAVASLL